jgi:hypothetical protein
MEGEGNEQNAAQSTVIVLDNESILVFYADPKNKAVRTGKPRVIADQSSPVFFHKPETLWLFGHSIFTLCGHTDDPDPSHIDPYLPRKAKCHQPWFNKSPLNK